MNSRKSNVARIFFGGGSLSMPAETPYERELIVECAGQCARRSGPVHLELDWSDWLVSVNDTPAQCASCARPVLALACRNGSQVYCARCVTAGDVCNLCPMSPRQMHRHAKPHRHQPSRHAV